MRRQWMFLALLLTVAANPGRAASPDDTERLVALALEQAVGKGSVPDFALAARGLDIVLRDSVVVSPSKAPSRAIPREALPRVRGHRLVLLDRQGMRDRADRRGDFMYVHVGPIEFHGDTATSWVGTSWMTSRTSRKVYLSGGGSKLEFVRTNGVWSFRRVIETWISAVPRSRPAYAARATDVVERALVRTETVS